MKRHIYTTAQILDVYYRRVNRNQKYAVITKETGIRSPHQIMRALTMHLAGKTGVGKHHAYNRACMSIKGETPLLEKRDPFIELDAAFAQLKRTIASVVDAVVQQSTSSRLGEAEQKIARMKRHYEEEIRSLKEELRAQKNESFSDMLKKRWGMTEKEVVNG